MNFEAHAVKEQQKRRKINECPASLYAPLLVGSTGLYGKATDHFILLSYATLLLFAMLQCSCPTVLLPITKPDSVACSVDCRMAFVGCVASVQSTETRDQCYKALPNWLFV